MKKEFTRFRLALLTVTFLLTALSGCKKDDYTGEVAGECPVVVSTDPMDKAVDVALDKLISVTFNTDMDSTSITSQTFIIKQGTTVVTGKLATTTDPKTFSFKPDAPLIPFALYSGTVTTGAKDRFKTAMEADYNWTFTAIPQISLTALPTAGGTILGAGTFAEASSVTVEAVPNEGYTFTSWTNNGTVVSTSSSFQFPMAGNKSLVANFTAIPLGSFAVNLSSLPAAGGSTVGSGSYIAGTLVTITAAAHSGYTFVNWTEGGVVVASSTSVQFAISANRTFVANFKIVPAAQFAVVLSSSPTAGGMTDGEGSYPSETSVTIKAAENPGYKFVDWTDKASGLVASTSSTFVFPIKSNRTFVANFVLNTYTLTTIAVNGRVTKSLDQPRYNHGTRVILTAVPDAGYVFSEWSRDASGKVNPLSVLMTSDKTITAIFTPIPGTGPAPINLGTAGQFGILTKTGITTTGVTSITGDLGVSPIVAAAITGFDLIMDINGESSHTPIVNGKVYASDYKAPTPSKLTTAVSDMETAFTTANGLVTPAPIDNIHNGDISGTTLEPGLYKWTTGLKVSGSGVTLSGGPNDTWVFQISKDLTLEDAAKVRLTGGAQAKNIFWVVSGQAVLNSNSDLSGIILSKTLISLKSGAKVTGRLLAQTEVTLIGSTVVTP